MKTHLFVFIFIRLVFGFKVGNLNLKLKAEKDFRGRKTVKRAKTPFTCSLTKLTSGEVEKLLPLSVSKDQWSNYWGNGVEQVGRIYETMVIAFLGLFSCYFASFLVGTALTSAVGFIFVFYWIIGPNFINYQKNRDFRGTLAEGKKGPGTRVALFSANVKKIIKEKNPVTERLWKFQILVEDEKGRSLRVRVPPNQSIKRIKYDMELFVLLISDSPNDKFDEIRGVSDAFVPSAGVWVGKYPYISKLSMKEFLRKRKFHLADKSFSKFSIEKEWNDDLEEKVLTETKYRKDDLREWKIEDFFNGGNR
mmetsp:Transcript_9287/g.13955  ORF Transcript_9287/g.13955 Transcript_9287/m.13955 type:complete len:307 (+) Transcript_9287:183-1103(+)